MKRTLALSLLVCLATTTNLFAQAQARMAGKVIDAQTKEPIAGVVIKYEATERKTIKNEVKAKADGSYAILVMDGTIRYKFTFTADGYTPHEEVIKLTLGDPNMRDFELTKVTGAPGSAGMVTGAKVDPSVELYNEGAALANAADYAGAVAKFEQAVALKPELMAGWVALAKMSLRLEQYPKAIEAAKKVLEIDEQDTDMWSVLYTAYTATGDKANALVAEKKMPANAPGLFNQAARLINQGDDTQAEKLLRQAVTIDPKMAVAFYELGMVYVRTGQTGEAREALSKYIELDPKGKDVSTAKEMLKYLN
jgi:tetratricopeptide (TPR) repeat protein